MIYSSNDFQPADRVIMDGLSEGPLDDGMCVSVQPIDYIQQVAQDYWDLVRYFRLFQIL